MQCTALEGIPLVCIDLYDWQKCIDNFGSCVFNLLVPCPLFQLGHIVPGDIFVRHRQIDPMNA